MHALESLFQFVNNISPISAKMKSAFENIFKQKYLKKGEIFIDAGVYAREMGFLKSGIIRAFYRTTDGKEYNKHFFQEPCFIGGYASFISGQPNQIIQEALTDCEIWVADYAKLTDLYDSHPDLERMSRKLAEYFFVQKEQREVEIVLLDADERYAIFQKQFANLEQQIPQYHIASYLGITPTQLSRIRRKR
ncbi:Crp/Fnr family transcriptional regulator [Arcticibacterium luteifluviistationis]|uniref:Crp/Fnr family transcriptional regulator n=1 Tax=Arcticibacterium luteifluviistationis TaxID=1784714 RepID=A0A2Z4GCW6_9BACT|nr:Crp/Fnr family transcriptional regulator [Arcticibacterium luteifluviistationis]AWV98918.1 Crp/Fnr family transcriptional regulator [Arcticibacterium luteifluviistationis]